MADPKRWTMLERLSRWARLRRIRLAERRVLRCARRAARERDYQDAWARHLRYLKADARAKGWIDDDRRDAMVRTPVGERTASYTDDLTTEDVEARRSGA